MRRLDSLILIDSSCSRNELLSERLCDSDTRRSDVLVLLCVETNSSDWLVL